MHLNSAFWSCTTVLTRLDWRHSSCSLFWLLSCRFFRRLCGFRIPGGSRCGCCNRYIVLIFRVSFRFRRIALRVMIYRDHIIWFDWTVAKTAAIIWVIWVWVIIEYAILTNFTCFGHLTNHTVDAIFTRFACVGHRRNKAQCYVTLHLSVKHTSRYLNAKKNANKENWKTQKLKIKTKEWKSKMIHAEMTDEKNAMQITFFFYLFPQIVLSINWRRSWNRIHDVIMD